MTTFLDELIREGRAIPPTTPGDTAALLAAAAIEGPVQPSTEAALDATREDRF